MWARTFIGLAVSLLVNASLMINMTLLLPLNIDTRLFLGYVFGFIVWAGFMTYFYCSYSIGKALKTCVPLLGISVGLNTILITGVLA